MNRLATIALTVAGIFLVIMAILVNSPPLFYMTVAVLMTLAASRFQAFLAVRALRFDRTFPPAVSLGETVTIETVVWSEKRIQRPLVTVEDELPPNLLVIDRTPSLPVAPAIDQPIKTRFSFRPLRRGRYKWDRLTVRGTDALGLVMLEKSYQTEPVTLTVYPAPIPVSLAIRPHAGWGTTDIESGVVRGSGIQPRGVREFVHGDAVRHIHWPTSARTGRLMVKEFDSGSGLSLAFVLQDTLGTEVGSDSRTTFEAMCGHALFLAEHYLESGAQVWFPKVEHFADLASHPAVRTREVRDLLTDATCDNQQPLSAVVRGLKIPDGTTLVVFACILDPDLPATLAKLSGVRTVCCLYDASAFDPKSGKASALSGGFIDDLESSGVEVHAMPLPEARL